jgi:hypothetical protein
LQKAEKDLHALLRAAPAEERVERARSAYEDINLRKLRPVLVGDQRHRCVYCEAEIVDDGQQTTVSHWNPVKHHPDHALHWQNLYASCKSHVSCDAKQGSRTLAHTPGAQPLPWPSKTPYEAWIGFTRGGEIYARKSKPIPPAVRRALHLAFEDQRNGNAVQHSLLGLNCPALREARKQAMDRERSWVEAQFPGLQAPANMRQRRARELLAAAKGAAFVSIRVAWLTGDLGKDRP